MQSKSIRIREVTYERLRSLRAPRESYNEVIERLLNVMETWRAVSDTLGPAHYLRRERPEEVK